MARSSAIGQLVLYSEAITLSGHYTSFFTLGQGVLTMLGATHRVSIQHADIDELRMRMLTMPEHSDVPARLKQLKDAKFRLMMLTNSPPDPMSPRREKMRRYAFQLDAIKECLKVGGESI
jgi:hypothetical protein